MNLGTIIGLLLGLGLLGLAVFLGANEADVPILKLWHTVSLLIVLGGSLSATAIAFKMKDVLHLFGLLKMIFKDDNFTLANVVEDVCSLSESYRKSRKDLEEALSKPPESMPFRMHPVQDGCEFILQGTKPDDIENIMVNMEEYRDKRESNDAKVMKTLGVYAPAFGMVGTLIGLVFMLAGMGSGGGGSDASQGMAKLMESMAVALITTLYGAVFANFLFLPFADKLKGKNDAKKIESALCTEGVLLIAHKKHPLEIKARLNAYLPNALRFKEEE